MSMYTQAPQWRDSHTLVYLPAGRAAHYLAPSQSPNNPAAHALCGVTNWPAYFLGTGSQAEHDEAASRPLCKTCARKRGESEA